MRPDRAMGRKRFYDAVRDLIRDVTVEEPAAQRARLSRMTVSALLAAPLACGACWDEVAFGQTRTYECEGCMSLLCEGCLRAYALAALRDRALLPLRCAGTECRAVVPLSRAAPLLTPDVRAALIDAARPPSAPPPDDEAVRTLMEAQGWRRCPDCGAGIERTHGCPHMTCTCGGEFCYDCGARWADGCVPTCARLTQPRMFIDEQYQNAYDQLFAQIVGTMNRLRTLLADRRQMVEHMDPPAREPPVENVGGQEARSARAQTASRMSISSLTHPC